jgi:hypothetical protein
MTLFFVYDATDDLVNRVRLSGEAVSGIEPITKVFNGGTTATSSLTVDDPLAELDLLGLKNFWIEEDACDPPRIVTGHVFGDVQVSRGPYRSGVSRIWTIPYTDTNDLLGLRVFHTDEAKRPRESVNDRLAWLLSEIGGPPWVGLNFTTDAFIADEPSMIDESDYRGQHPYDVLNDCCALFGGRQYSAFYDHDLGTTELFYGDPDTGVGTSTLRISNDIDDVDRVVTFWPFGDSTLTRSSEGVYSGVYFTYRNGAIYRTRVATQIDFIDRDANYDTQRVGALATANAQAAAFLESHKDERETISCTVRLPRDKVNLIREGLVVDVKFTHLPGYTSFTSMLVISCSPLLTAGTNLTYDVSLELCNAAVASHPGGGDPGIFPAPPGECEAPVPLHVYPFSSFDIIDNYVTPGWTPADGNTLLLYRSGRDVGTIDPPNAGDWTVSPQGIMTNDTDAACVFLRPTTASESPNIVVSGLIGNSASVLIELPGVMTFTDSVESTGTASAPVLGAVTPNAGAPAFVVGFVCGHAGENTHPVWSPGTGWTEALDLSPGGHPQNAAVYKAIASPSGSYTPDVAFTGSTAPIVASWAAQSFALSGDPCVSPPMPGQTVHRETVAVGDGTTTTFTTSFPYADGSLTVYVDLLDQTGAVTSFDGATGDFTLGFAPAVGELVQVTYQGR